MRFHRLLTAWAVVSTTSNGFIANAAQPRALVYRGPAACKGCAEAVAQLLENSPQKFTVTYVGPNEDTNISSDSLKGVDVYAQPGGPDLNSAWAELQDHQTELRDFITKQGGRYLGFCLGAFLAGSTPGLGLLPEGANAVSERKQDNAQVTNTRDTIIQIDWTFRSSIGNYSKGETAVNRWVYFQDGAAITGLSGGNSSVLGRYSQNGDVAASLTPLGKGWVALVGAHPEATKSWYRSYDLSNPDGLNSTIDIGYDFVTAAMGRTGTNTTSNKTSEESAANPGGQQQGRLALPCLLGWFALGLAIFWI
ncbi:biotin protein ligase [Pochonia chlamydosporia 170]|uniref:Biotin protein ligase n=1 Tax=Pochonia chlamydosporia 170 TaxID=1380566 RepID=A0A179F7L0_METCM|nr:biotin protein ligase [Pochonia chlamydosporia 170]OAQ61406.1 biotin protein ligase [Pochonia chlamydosporia 170]